MLRRVSEICRRLCTGPSRLVSDRGPCSDPPRREQSEESGVDVSHSWCRELAGEIQLERKVSQGTGFLASQLLSRSPRSCGEQGLWAVR